MYIKVGDFKKKTKIRSEALTKRLDFASRRYKQADDNMRSGDYAKAMQSLMKVDAEVNLNNVEKAIKDHLSAYRW